MLSRGSDKPQRVKEEDGEDNTGREWEKALEGC